MAKLQHSALLYLNKPGKLNRKAPELNRKGYQPSVFKDLEEKASASAQAEIRVGSSKHGEGLLTYYQ